MNAVKRIDELFGYREPPHPPPSDAALDRLARLAPGPLPSEYVAAVTVGNGQIPKPTLIRLKGGREFAVAVMFAVTEDDAAVENIWVENGYGDLPPKCLAFGDDGCGNLLALDFSSAPPRVVLLDHEDENEAIEVAPSFAEMLAMLY